jgi:hypothetical protein
MRVGDRGVSVVRLLEERAPRGLPRGRVRARPDQDHDERDDEDRQEESDDGEPQHGGVYGGRRQSASVSHRPARLTISRCAVRS